MTRVNVIMALVIVALLGCVLGSLLSCLVTSGVAVFY